MKRVLVVVGTRPEAIKMAPVVRALAPMEGLESRLILTGQHTDMVSQVLDAFSLEADHDLAIMKPGQSLYDVAEGCLNGLRAVVSDLSPDMILVQGDTATVFFAALVGFFERVSVGHVEAGLRSHDRWAPYPEEILRRLTDTITELHFAPTSRSAANLRAEGVEDASIHITGNTVVDALLQVADVLPPVVDPVLRETLEGGGQVALLTAHRREAFGAPLREIFSAVRELVERRPGLTVVYPVHPNPNVRGPASEILGGTDRIRLTDPVGYFDLVHALRRADLVLTDSGGIQEEAPTFGVPVLVLREVTERPEGVDAGAATLVGWDRARILEAAHHHLDAHGETGDPAPNPYGDGHAGARIADLVRHRLTGAPREWSDWAPA